MSASSYQEHTFKTSDLLPAVPSTPTVTITGTTIVVEVDVYDAPTKKIEFQIYSITTGKVRTTADVDVKANHASYTETVAVGSTYKVKCRASNGTVWSDWSQYSGSDTTVPYKPGSITSCKATTSTSVMVEWTASKNATGYTIEYATDNTYFDVSDQVRSTTVDVPEVKPLIS